MPTLEERIIELENKIEPIEFLVFNFSNEGEITDSSGNVISQEQYDTMKTTGKKSNRRYIINIYMEEIP